MNFFGNIIPPKEVDFEDRRYHQQMKNINHVRGKVIYRTLNYFEILKLNLGDDH